jgi:hypothetical protein
VNCALVYLRRGIYQNPFAQVLVILPFVEAIGVSAAANMLFEDAAILLQLGYTALQIQEGFNRRHRNKSGEKSEQARPCHPDVLREELARIKPESLHQFRRRCVQELFERRLIRGKVYAVDGSGLGKKRRVVGLLNINEKRTVWVTWRLLTGNASEKGKEGSVLREMVDEVREIGGEAAIEWLLMDALYADGPVLAWLKHHRGIDALVRLPEDRAMYADLWSLLEVEPQRWQEHLDVRYVAGRKQLRKVRVGTVGDLTSWDSFLTAAHKYGVHDASLWGCAIHATDQSDPQQTETWALVSTSPFSTGWKAFSKWRKRWRIENNGFRELKEGWHLERAPWSYSSDTVTLARLTFTLIGYNVAEIAKTTAGRQLTRRGIRRLRRDLTREVGPAPVIVFADGAYGIFDIEEVMIALDNPPRTSVRRPSAQRSASVLCGSS